MTESNNQFSAAKILTALLLGYGCALGWVVYADVVYHNNVPLDAIQFHGLYPISLGLSAVAAALLFDKNLRSLGFRKFKAQHLMTVALIAAAVLIIPFLLNLLLQITRINSAPVFYEGLVIIGIPVLVVLAVGEEVMWRGLLYEEFSKKYNFTQTSLIIGILWALWHYPVIIHTKFIYADRPLWFALPAFTAMVVGSSFVYNYIRKISGSVWPCVFLHAFVNYIAFVLIEPLEQRQAAGAVYFVNDIGVFYTAAYILGAVWLLRKVN